VSGKLDYDLHTSAAILAALMQCPSDQRMDSLAAAVKIAIEQPGILSAKK
jgi:hypothetical protein